MAEICVVDTCAIISYFKDVFKQESSVSQKSLRLIDRAFYDSTIKLIVPSAVFVELFKKWFSDKEMAEKIKYEIYYRIKEKENMEIQPLDKEILSNFLLITDIEPNYNFDNHDKQVYASAITMDCALITSDTKILRYNKRKGLLKKIYV